MLKIFRQEKKHGSNCEFKIKEDLINQILITHLLNKYYLKHGIYNLIHHLYVFLLQVINVLSASYFKPLLKNDWDQYIIVLNVRLKDRKGFCLLGWLISVLLN